MSTIFGILTLLLALATTISLLFWTWKNQISPSPTSSKIARQLFQVLAEEKIHPGTIYELGAGWGTLVFPLAEKYPAHQVKAYESSPVPYFFCLLRQWFRPHSNLVLERQNFFDIDLKDASLVICYLYPKAMELLNHKFALELSPGSLVITHTFRLPGKIPYRTITCNDIYSTIIYLYHY